MTIRHCQVLSVSDIVIHVTGAERGTPGSENSDKDVVPDRQCGNGLGTTQLFPAATVPRNTEHQLEAAPEDAPEESLVQFLFQ